MALVPVRSKEPVNGEKFVTEASEEWLSRWPEDFDRLEGEELTRYELAKSGLNPLEINDVVVASVAALAAPTADGETETETEPSDDSLDATVSDGSTTAPDAAV